MLGNRLVRRGALRDQNVIREGVLSERDLDFFKESVHSHERALPDEEIMRLQHDDVQGVATPPNIFIFE